MGVPPGHSQLGIRESTNSDIGRAQRRIRMRLVAGGRIELPTYGL
jgi:hypothetical protein